jgi:CHAT domain-containing protein
VRDALGAPPESVIAGEDATKARLVALNARDQLAQYRYLLFATHAVLPNEINGINQPALVFAHPENDGFLTMADVFGLRLDADFVALSACNTGRGAQDAADGISGMTRAFLYAGTPAISVTLWAVDDRAAPQITPQFFQAMKAGASPAQALRQAKLALLGSSDPRFRHPYAWAPTVIFGDGGTLRR